MPHTLKLPDRVPVLPVRSTVVFPSGATGLQIGFPPNIEALARHPQRDLLVATVWTADEQEQLDAAALEKVGTAVRVLDRLNLPGGTLQCTLQGLARIHLEDVRSENGMYSAVPRLASENGASPEFAAEVVDQIFGILAGLSARVERISDEVPRILRMNLADPGRFADLVATLCNLKVADRDATLQELDVLRRLEFVRNQLNAAWEKVQAQAADAQGGPPGEQQATSNPGEIRKRIQALQAQLGELDPLEREGIQMLRRIEAADLPPHVAAAARREVEKLVSGTVGPRDSDELRGYLEALLAMPWNRRSASSEIDLGAVRAAMEETLMILKEPRRRTLEVLSVGRLRGQWDGLIPCLVGPPSVGKRSLVEAVARGLGRPFVRVELGGRSEADLFGTRRGQTSGQLGRLAAAIRDAGTSDAVVLLEELDEIGLGNVGGNPADALEQVLKSEPRRVMTDRYLEIELDLGQTIFFATANDFLRVPRDLRGVFVPIPVIGYTPEEKVAIARDRLLPRLAEEHGISGSEAELSDATLLFLTRGYARDAGLASLKRALSALLRAAAYRKATTGSAAPPTRDEIEEILGPPRYNATPAEQAPEVGVVTGLAWTASGGELLFIEALRMPGTGKLRVTGSIGDVMRESVNAAYSYVRSRADTLGVAGDVFGAHDVHVHFPAGATPKDGPSAGAAVTLAIASCLADRPVRHDVAMTGEVTLRGRVLEVGGIKEKVLAAHRAGVREVILPRGNERDLRDVPAEASEEMTFHLVDRMDDILAVALLPRRRKPRSAAPTARRAAAERQAARGSG